MKSRLIAAIAAAVLLPFAVTPAFAQDYPSRIIRIVSPYAAGGGNDTISRLLADRLGTALNQRVIVENRPGGNTIIGNEVVAKSPPDGYTLILNGNGFVTNPSFYSRIPYDTAKDIIPVAFVGFSQLALVVHPGVPAANVRELIALAKAKPTALNFGTSGHGGPDHLADVLFNQLAGTNIALIPYKGSAPAITDVLGGQVQLMITPLAAVQPHINSGKMRLVAFATATRSPQYPDIPTLAEAGVPGYEAFLWYGLMAPAGTPQPIVKRLNDEVNKILRQKDVIDKFAASGITMPDENLYGTPEKFAAFIRQELATTARAVASAGIRPE